MGRNRLTTRESIQNLGFSYRALRVYPIDEKESTIKELKGEEIILGIDRIVDRERTTRSEIIMRALAGYWYRHNKGNTQTLLPSFDTDGVKSMGQLEQECFNYFRGRDEINAVETVNYLADRDVPPRERVKMGERVRKALAKNGVKILGRGK